jgi:3-oxoacyl-[acyl-carrier-protein] synthase II
LPPSGRDVHITGWSALSPFGVGRSAFVGGYLAGQDGHRPDPGPAAGGGDYRVADYRVADFDPVAVLGRKGTRSLDRFTLMVTATVELLVAEHAETLGTDRTGIGLVLGTSTGSIASIVEFTRDTFEQRRPYHVNPAAFPNTVMNGAAGHTAIWHQLRGLNSTVAAGQLTGLAALRYATRMIRRGYADTLLVGCVEELSEPFEAAAEQLRAAGDGAVAPIAVRPGDLPLGEGCVMFLVDGGPSPRRALAEMIDFEFAVAPGGASRAERTESLVQVVQALLTRNSVAPADLWRVVPALGGAEELALAEQDALAQIFPGTSAPEQLPLTARIGSSFSAHAGFQLAAALAVAQQEPAGATRRPVLVTGLGLDGAVAAGLLTA